MSDDFNDFFGIILIIAFLFAFWNAFSEGKIKEKTPTQEAQGVLPSQTVSPAPMSGYQNGPINSVQYIPAQ